MMKCDASLKMYKTNSDSHFAAVDEDGLVLGTAAKDSTIV